jgi:PAS domain S-box-containing protein
MTSMKPASALADAAAVQRLARERFIWRFRLAAVLFTTLQTVIEPGDSRALTWINVALFWSSVAWSWLALRDAPDDRTVRRVGAITMVLDVAVVALILANNLTDPMPPRPSQRIVALDYATMRAGTIIALGIFLGRLVRRLSIQHDMLQGILDTTRDLIVVIDHDGTIRSVNAASVSMLGYSPAEMVDRRYSEFFHPDDVRTGPGQQLQMPTDGPVLHERRVIARDGSARWLELNTAAVFAFDLGGRFTMVNPASVRLTGYPPTSSWAPRSRR